MFSSRAALRTTRAVRVNAPALRRNVRFANGDASAGSSAGGMSPTITAALIGFGASTATFYLAYQFSGLSTAVGYSKQAKSYIDGTTNQLKAQFKDKTPDDSSEVIQALRDTANKYARWLPGGKQYVDKAFDDLEKIRQQHGGEVDNIVKEAYGELRDASKKGMNFDAISDVWDILQKHLGRLSGLAVNAGHSILENHPQLKQQFGGSFDQLKQLGDQAGPEAKKQVDETWQQISKILSGGFGLGTIDQIRKLVDEKTQQLKQYGDQAWQKGYEQLKPMLDKNPQVKKMVEENVDTLKQGNVSQAVSTVQSAISSGSTQDLEKYINQAKDKAQQYSSSSSSGQLTSWLNMVPGGSQILPALQKYREVAEKHGDEAQKIAKDTMHEIMQVIDKRSNELEKLAGNAKQDAEKKGGK